MASKLISLSLAKSHLRVGDSNHDDELITDKIEMAVAIAGDFTSRDLEVEFAVCPERLPGGIKAAILLILGTIYDNETDQLVGRSVSELPMSAEKLLQKHRRYPYGRAICQPKDPEEQCLVVKSKSKNKPMR